MALEGGRIPAREPLVESTMARYVTSLRTARSPDDAFAYLADLRNFADWDPSVSRAELVTGTEPGPDAEYDVGVEVGPRTLTLRYRTEVHDPPRRVRVRAESRLLTSIDTINVTPVGAGCEITYDAVLHLPSGLSLLDSLLERAFRRTGDKAAAGLRRVFDADARP